MAGSIEGEGPHREPTPEQRQNSPQTGEGLPGLLDRQPEQPNLQQDITPNTPILEKGIGQTGLTKQSRAIFENCIVRDLMPSVEQLEIRLAEGHITEEQAAVEKKRVLLRERLYTLGDRVGTIQMMFIRGDFPAEEKQSLRAEYKKLKKEMRSIRREQREND